jgi:hypothetical protein
MLCVLHDYPLYSSVQFFSTVTGLNKRLYNTVVLALPALLAVVSVETLTVSGKHWRQICGTNCSKVREPEVQVNNIQKCFKHTTCP